MVVMRGINEKVLEDVRGEFVYQSSATEREYWGGSKILTRLRQGFRQRLMQSFLRRFGLVMERYISNSKKEFDFWIKW